jgi:hypothetical protein
MAKNLYLNRKIQLYPRGCGQKFGIITNADDYGFVIKITSATSNSGYNAGQEYFISHSTAFDFIFVD